MYINVITEFNMFSRRQQFNQPQPTNNEGLATTVCSFPTPNNQRTEEVQRPKGNVNFSLSCLLNNNIRQEINEELWYSSTSTPTSIHICPCLINQFQWHPSNLIFMTTPLNRLDWIPWGHHLANNIPLLNEWNKRNNNRECNKVVGQPSTL